ncbi:MAG: hypothetical protein IID41_02780 [Planctomycetes bacterium]|nr:hypothetical protein [Planctomycetota bacterium]
MKTWMWFVLATVVFWGAYVPMIHHGQQAFGTKNSALRTFLFIGLAYFLVSAVVLTYTVLTKAEPLAFTRSGVSLSMAAGILGALGALGIVFAMKSGGKPLAVAPLVFAGAPIMSTFVAMMWDKPARPPGLMFYVGIATAALGAAMVLRFRPT